MTTPGKVITCLLAVVCSVSLETQASLQVAAIDECIGDDSCSPSGHHDGIHMSLLQYNHGTKENATEVIRRTLSRIKSAPQDLALQLKGCSAMQALADMQREGPGPYGGRRVSTALLSAGIAEPIAQALLNSVAIESAPGHIGLPFVSQLVSATCFGVLTGLTVQNDYEKGLALITNAPNVWHGIVAYFKAYKHTAMANASLCTFAGFFGTPQPRQAAEGMVEAGAIDFIIDEYLNDESLKSDPEQFQRVYCALSDPVHEASGAVARAIANHGGALQGIPLMVRTLEWANEVGSDFHESNGFGLLYEGIHDIGGVLEHDDTNHNFGNSFVEAGLVEQLIPAMQQDPDDRRLQDMACEAIKWISDDNVTTQGKLVEAGALEIMAAALKQHSHPPYKGYGAVTIACSTALLNFAGDASWRDRLRRLEVYDTLNEEVLAAFPESGSDDFIMRQQWFPNSKIYELKKVLQPF